MARPRQTKQEQRARNLLEQRGYVVVPRPPKYKIKTFEVDESLLPEFMAEVSRRGIKVKEAISDAIRLWLKTHTK